MKTSLEAMNMNATYEVRSQHIVDFQTQFHCNEKIYITHTLLGRIFIKIHYKALKYCVFSRLFANNLCRLIKNWVSNLP